MDAATPLHFKPIDLDRHADLCVRFFRQAGCSTLQLSASLDNRPALRFYQRNGWRDIGPHESSSGMNRFERKL